MITDLGRHGRWSAGGGGGGGGGGAHHKSRRVTVTIESGARAAERVQNTLRAMQGGVRTPALRSVSLMAAVTRLHRERRVATVIHRIADIHRRIVELNRLLKAEGWNVVLEFDDAGTALGHVAIPKGVDRARFAAAVFSAGDRELMELHRAGLIHGDIHLDNLVLIPAPLELAVRDPDAWIRETASTLSLIDFGSAVPLTEGVFRGKPNGGRWGLMHHAQFPDPSGDVVMSRDVDRFALAALCISFSIGHKDLFIPPPIRARKATRNDYKNHALRDPAALLPWLKRHGGQKFMDALEEPIGVIVLTSPPAVGLRDTGASARAKRAGPPSEEKYRSGPRPSRRPRPSFPAAFT